MRKNHTRNVVGNIGRMPVNIAGEENHRFPSDTPVRVNGATLDLTKDCGISDFQFRQYRPSELLVFDKTKRDSKTFRGERKIPV